MWEQSELSLINRTKQTCRFWPMLPAKNILQHVLFKYMSPWRYVSMHIECNGKYILKET